MFNININELTIWKFKSNINAKTYDCRLQSVQRRTLFFYISFSFTFKCSGLFENQEESPPPLKNNEKDRPLALERRLEIKQFSKIFEFISALQINGGLQENTSSIPLMHNTSRKYI